MLSYCTLIINVSFLVKYLFLGSNSITKFKPYVTSYDYDAPLNEAGDPTPKYYAIRNVLKQVQ